MKKLALIFIFMAAPLAAQSNQADNPDVPGDTALSNGLSNTGFLDAFYAGQNATNQAPAAAGENIFFTLMRVVFITGILGFLTWLVLKYFFRKNTVAVSSAGSPIEILSTTPAGLNVFFVVAKLHSQYYLLSLSTEGLRLIDKISDKETIDFLEINKDVPVDTKFVDLIEKMPEGQPKKAMEFLRSKIDQLRKK